MCSVRAHSLVQCADRGCPGRNAVFFTCPPPLGVLGVPLEALCDVDESFAFLADCDRQHGYAFVGHEATILSNYVKGTKWTIMLAVGYTGLVNYWIHRENTTGEVRNAFLCCPLLGCVLLSACCSALSHLSIWLV